jgi:hypothetical protein
VKAIDVWMSSCSVFVFLSLFEFAVVNNYMGPVATKAMKGYSDEDLTGDLDAFKVCFIIIIATTTIIIVIIIITSTITSTITITTTITIIIIIIIIIISLLLLGACLPYGLQ